MLPTGFIAFLTDLINQATANTAAAMLPGVAYRSWAVPSTYPIGIDIQNPVGFILACNRSPANAACVQEYLNGAIPNTGRRGVVLALKTAIDYWAAWERSLHARYASAVRCRIWGASRRAGHSDGNNGIFAIVSQYLQSMIAASQSVPNTPGGDEFSGGGSLGGGS